MGVDCPKFGYATLHGEFVGKAGTSRRHRHWYAKGVKPLFAVNVKLKRRKQ